MFDFVSGIIMLVIGFDFAYDMVSRGRSPITGSILGIKVPIRLLQAVVSLLMMAGGIYLLLR
ncbi:hypothetical protein [Saccharibacillus kuerlensis]|uniref:Uncharacterized protein n=1 Tax=Saccharibacillus kuerlensis TaxID=459527 RepID=A0ABQ2KR83_9BACL|nr:hypothetical protein [Saccharibacillus kuerlensis]GGN90983.1 hypothetical protein GCM10010969_01990 [Saccharibacillus kuerlensis]